MLQYLIYILIPFQLIFCSSLSGQAATDTCDSIESKEIRIRCKLEKTDSLSDYNLHEALDSAMDILFDARQLKSEEILADVLFSIGDYCTKLNLNTQALEYLFESLENYKKLGNIKKEEQVLLNIGHVYRSTEQYELALDYYLNGRKHAYEIKDTALIITSDLSIGATYANMGLTDSATNIFHRTLELSGKLGDEKVEMKNLYYLADLYRYTGKANKAIKYNKQVLNKTNIKETNPNLLSGSLCFVMFFIYDFERVRFRETLQRTFKKRN